MIYLRDIHKEDLFRGAPSEITSGGAPPPIRYSLDTIPRKATALNFDKDIYMTCSIYNQLYIFYMSSDNDPIRRNSHTFEYPLSLMLELWMLVSLIHQSHGNLHQLRVFCMCSCCRLPTVEKNVHQLVVIVLCFSLVYHVL